MGNRRIRVKRSELGLFKGPVEDLLGVLDLDEHQDGFLTGFLAINWARKHRPRLYEEYETMADRITKAYRAYLKRQAKKRGKKS